ncbi:hypothetical protein [Mesorhizobium sp. P15089B]
MAYRGSAIVAFEAARNLCLCDLQQRVYFEHRRRMAAVANDTAGAVEQVGDRPQRFSMARSIRQMRALHQPQPLDRESVPKVGGRPGE